MSSELQLLLQACLFLFCEECGLLLGEAADVELREAELTVTQP